MFMGGANGIGIPDLPWIYQSGEIGRAPQGKCLEAGPWKWISGRPMGSYGKQRKTWEKKLDLLDDDWIIIYRYSWIHLIGQ